jgi:hypothetical protein
MFPSEAMIGRVGQGRTDAVVDEYQDLQGKQDLHCFLIESDVKR